ncbi:unnamed protein product [Bemisia tabaci]|uniref:Alpha-D-phosphohexomutase alpha/beta/alpha domain-containing protein n=1 Tax=Bemisia tabaci TaxID=7038 RepID=A0A9P0EYS8_BEMTA|nr:unnamed protein product [Bemisia tabaci]
MITASHNPEDDNGIKIVDPMGEMLEGAWETYATDMVNTPDASLEQFLQRVIATHQVNLKAKSLVFLGWDTRYVNLPSCCELVERQKLKNDCPLLVNPKKSR